jgi:hypothetical protein
MPNRRASQVLRDDGNQGEVQLNGCSACRTMEGQPSLSPLRGAGWKILQLAGLITTLGQHHAAS